jgi:hypothetical protein
MTYDFDTDNSWLDAQVTAEPVKARTTSAKTTGRKQYQMSPEFRERVSQGARKQHADPKYRKKISDTLTGRRQTPEHTARAAEARRKFTSPKRPTPQNCAGNTARRSVQVTTPKGVFHSIKSAAEWYGVSPKTFSYWVYVSKTDQFSAKVTK